MPGTTSAGIDAEFDRIVWGDGLLADVGGSSAVAHPSDSLRYVQGAMHDDPEMLGSVLNMYAGAAVVAAPASDSATPAQSGTAAPSSEAEDVPQDSATRDLLNGLLLGLGFPQWQGSTSGWLKLWLLGVLAVAVIIIGVYFTAKEN